ncbi:DUF3080 family protein [Marinobacterium sp. AK62]|uniref:DUF3080 family protein n=1 Tax=Marinobacterium alkalitolerans TaxID=1542925 RepID=A0ABS3ZCE1_9GAMM|nr:DUF3080 family protein [Marinobacterium alkalitolerans]MBP0048990.1 DUF3080 family protein [Marinobacterium alkalitolerans]
MRFIILLTGLWLLSGCDSDPVTDRLQDYTARVSNSIEQDFELHLESNLPAYPPKRDRLLAVETLREGLIDVLDLRQCDLLGLIGERNSSLGKLAGHSQQLIYEFRFLPPLRQCIDKLQNAPAALDEDQLALLDRLQTIEAFKTRTLPRVMSNAVFNADEIEAQFALGQPPADMPDLARFSNLKPALERLVYLSGLTARTEWSKPEDIEGLEQDYERIYRTHFGSAWLRSLSYLTQTLEQTATAIEARLERRPLCFNKRPTPQANIVRNVFQKYYAGELQPWMSSVDRSGQQWRYYWRELLDNVPATPAVQDYFDQTLFTEDSLWARYIAARDRHTRAWQTLLSQCGMMPSA